jgi:hypothetical protein
LQGLERRLDPVRPDELDDSIHVPAQRSRDGQVIEQIEAIAQAERPAPQPSGTGSPVSLSTTGGSRWDSSSEPICAPGLLPVGISIGLRTSTSSSQRSRTSTMCAIASPPARFPRRTRPQALALAPDETAAFLR